jgi:hypothetical protein
MPIETAQAQQCRICSTLHSPESQWPATDLCEICQLIKEVITTEAAECRLISVVLTPSADASTVGVSLRVTLDTIGFSVSPRIDTRAVTIKHGSELAELALTDPDAYTRRHIVPVIQELLPAAVAMLNTRLQCESRAADRDVVQERARHGAVLGFDGGFRA